MGTDRHTLYCAVYAIFIKDHQVLLSLRKNTGWRDGSYGLPQGHLEKGETIKEAMQREIREEVGLTIDQTDLTFYHVMHRNEKGAGDREYLDFFFKIEYWQGEPVNAEPEKSEKIGWFDLDKLPANILPNVKSALNCYRSRIIFSEFG